MGNYNLAGQAVGNLALEFIYGGPHIMFSHIAQSQVARRDCVGSKSVGKNGPPLECFCP